MKNKKDKKNWLIVLGIIALAGIAAFILNRKQRFEPDYDFLLVPSTTESPKNLKPSPANLPYPGR